MNTEVIPGGARRYLPFLLSVARLLVVFAMLFQMSGAAFAYTWTDPIDYPPGSTVTIRGDNSDPDNDHNWLAGETVYVDVVGPNGYTAACEGVADGLGAWNCDVTLWNDLRAVGTYNYTATGLSSGNVELGMFTDAVGDFSLDFVASAPYSYNHLVGGGAFDDRTVGKHLDIVESLEAVDFACGDIVTFLTQVVVDDTVRAGNDAPQTIELDYEFLMDTTGQPGVAIGDITYVGVNRAPIVDLIPGEDNVDQGIVEYDGTSSVATLISESQTAPMFSKGARLLGTIEITGLDRNEEIIVRIDTRLYCQPGQRPTGNLQAAITAGRLTYIQGNVPVVPPANISVGNQTIPFYQFGDLHYPELDIQKTVTTADGTCPGVESLNIHSGDTVKYCYAVSNPSNVSNPPGAALYNVAVMDDNRTPADPSDDFAVILTTGLSDIDLDGQVDDLAAGATAYGEALVTIGGGLGTYVNTAQATGHSFPGGDPHPLTDTDTAAVVIVWIPEPAIDVEKYVSADGGLTWQDADTPTGPYLLSSTSPQFKFVVQNTGNVELSGISLTDSDFDLSGCTIPATLAAGASFECVITAAWAAGQHTDTATVSVSYGGESYSDTDDANYFGAAPAIDIQKTPDMQTVIYGQTASFTIVVKNTGNVPLTNVTVTDPLAPNCAATIGNLAVGQEHTYTCSLANITSGLTNVATATGSYGDTTVTDNDDAVVVVDLLPDISVVKTATPTSVPETGGDVTFDFVVTNNSSEPFILTALTDDKFGDLNGQGNCAVPQTIAAGGSYSCAITVFLSGDDLTAHTNVVTASGTDEQGNPDSATDDATVTFTDVAPMIRMTKTASPTHVPETGGDVTFTFLVENIGVEDVTLTALTDTMFGDLDGKGTCSVPQTILVGGSYSCEYTVFLASDSLTAHYNVATATAVDDDGTTATDDDDETVTFDDVAPMIRMTKTASPTHVPETGGDVTFTFLVENIGVEDVTLTALTDTMFGDLDGKGTCSVPQTILVGGSYSCEYTVFLASDSLTSHYNVATATAVDDDGTTATDDDDETVTFDDVAPAIRMTKTANPTHVPETGGDVTFTFLVENIGVEDVTLTALTDTVFGDLNGQGTCSVPQTILIGGSYSCAITVFLSSDSLTSHYNVATATAVDDENTPATDDDDETVTFDDILPTITVDKTASPTSVPETGGDVLFTFRVTNTSPEAVTIASLGDTDFSLAGDADCQVGTVLPVGGWCEFSQTEFVAGDYESGIAHENTFTATATDNDGNTATDDDSATVTFTDVTADIDVEKYVSIDGGLTWEDADTVTGPYMNAGINPRFKFVVTNVGSVALSNVDVTDDVFGTISLDGTLAPGASVDYYVTGTWAAGQHTNIATASGSFTDGAGNTETDTDTDAANYFGATPSYTVAKACASVQPVPQEGPALFRVTFTNNGNVALTITADDGIGTFSLAIGQTRSFNVSLAGPFSGLATADNTVNASATYSDDAGNPVTVTHNASASCRVGSRVNVLKLTQGVVDPTKTWTFSIWDGAHGFGGTKLADDNTSGDLDGLLDFGNLNLDRLHTYTLCEEQVPAGWTSFWRVDTNNDGIVDTTLVPYNPNASDNPPQDLGNRCVDLGALTAVDLLVDGGTLLFQVNNTYPGGTQRTPGYWKNWNRCTGGGQAGVADANGGWQEGYWLLEDVLDPEIGGGIVWDDILTNDSWLFPITTCAVGVDILDQRDLGDPLVPGDGAKHSNDAAYTLAMHLLAAQLNFGAGAGTCDAVHDAALAGEQLLDKYNFAATGDYLLNNNRRVRSDYNLALQLANTLDRYNNGLLCSGPGVSFSDPLDGDTVIGVQTIIVNVVDVNTVVQVEFLVDGAPIGVDTTASDGWSFVWDSTGVQDGSHTLLAVATNDLGETGGADVAITVDNVPDVVLPTLHVGDLMATTSMAKAGKWNARVTVTIHNASHAGVSGAAVSMMWSDGVIATCTTITGGACTIARNNIGANVLSLVLEVTGVTLSGYNYDAALNEESSITVNRPY